MITILVPTLHITQGFTLVELLIVIAIVGLLASVMVPNLLQAKAKANDSAAASISQKIATAAATVQVSGNALPSCSYAAPDATIWSGSEVATVRAGGTVTDISCTENPTRTNALDVTVTYQGGTKPSITTTIE
ncbi:type II secretion system protein [Deinococcus caeni]|uniref:type II secretion system protein n=1 Tax=Deinococcus caeni TaxID=569127 RepID=UPI0031E79A2A